MLRRGLAVLLACVLAGPAARAETIRIGAILPLTGPAATIGARQMRGIQFAIDRANEAGGVRGNKIEVEAADSEAKPNIAILAFRRLVDARHIQIVLTGWSGPVLAMAPLATRNKILLINAGAQADKLAVASPFLFNTLPSVGSEIAVLSRYLAELGKHKAVILFENTAAGISGRDDFEDAFPGTGGIIVARETTLLGQTGFQTELKTLAAARPDTMLASMTTGLPEMARQYRALGLNFLVAGTTFFQDPGLLAEPAAEGFIHTQIRSEVAPEIAAAFERTFNADMDFFARQFYRASHIALTALDRVLGAGQPVTGETMRAAILNIRRLDGPVPPEFKTTAPIDINVVRGGKDVTIRRGPEN